MYDKATVCGRVCDIVASTFPELVHQTQGARRVRPHHLEHLAYIHPSINQSIYG